jgi:hypothetical protein
MANLNNPVNVLYQDETTGQPVAVRQDTPLPVDLTALLAIIGAADDEPGDNTVMGQLKQIAVNTTPTP